ncbi:MAG TPA: PBP1A family penicillin-binding protein [Geminicoccaceae bacterium]|nr:PBP1A family penicillin-binding protein [Geminicoccus sp.]HMU49417.1 PBP1A family penicillin-binding protein [Geminicoccaceae bacterium]
MSGQQRRPIRGQARSQPRPQRRAPGPPERPRRRSAGLLTRLAVSGVLLILVGWVALFVWYAPRLPDTDELFREAQQVRVKVLAADGGILAERGGAGRPFVRLDQMSPWLPKAVIAIEDRRFWDHSGVDPTGILRAAWANLRAGGTVEGGSTITQQLAKNLYLTHERSWGRKLEELVLAIWLESRLTKEQILTLYLNRVYLGAGAYGVEAASQRYFGKTAAEVGLSEAAVIAGLLKAPSRYSPASDLDLARERAATVLAVMAEQGVIDEREAVAARARPAKLSEPVQIGGWFVDWVLEGLTRDLGKPTRDLVVRTTLDPKLQLAAEAAVRKLLPARAGLEAAAVVLDGDGAVRALVGGRSYGQSPYNRAVNARRQPGSAFKPFVFLTALEQGWTPAAAIQDAPVQVKGWRPANIDGRYHGTVSLTQALAMSMNAAAVRLGEAVQPKEVAATARRLGIASPLPAVASLALGTAEVGVLELTGAYLPLANGGMRRPTWSVESVTDARGTVLYRYRPTEVRVLAPTVAAQMGGMLRAVVSEGTGRAAALPDRRVAGKTGTTQDNRDAWFVGFDERLVMGVWIGYDDDRPMRNVTGGGLPSKIWREVMQTTPAPAPQVAAAEPMPQPRPAVRQDNGLELLLDWVQRKFGVMAQ